MKMWTLHSNQQTTNALNQEDAAMRSKQKPKSNLKMTQRMIHRLNCAMPSKPLLLGVIISTQLMGCAAIIKTPYTAPEVSIPSHYVRATSSNVLNAVQQDLWWQGFNDPILNTWVNAVLARNADLAVAGINLKQARLQAGLAADQQGLRTNASVSSGTNINLGNGERNDQGLNVSAGVSYELDLFGKLARQSDAAGWEAVATEQDLQATAQSLVATTVQLYWQQGYLKQQLLLAQQNLTTSEKLLQLVQVQYKAGAVSGLELTQAQQAVQGQKATVEQIVQQQFENRTALAVLLQQPVQQLNLPEATGLTATLPSVQMGLPADLLSRRPDLKAAELRLRKVLASADATRASYYPSISLTGNLGTSSTALSNLVKNPILALGASVNLPFLQVNDMRKNIAISQLDYEKAIVQYRQTLYQAFADVENALNARQSITNQVALQQQNVALAEKAERLTEVRYRNGAIALSDWLTAQQTLRTARLSLLQTQLNLYNAHVTVLQALGGSVVG